MKEVLLFVLLSPLHAKFIANGDQRKLDRVQSRLFHGCVCEVSVELNDDEEYLDDKHHNTKSFDMLFHQWI